jgi:hypothetical protein
VRDLSTIRKSLGYGPAGDKASLVNGTRPNLYLGLQQDLWGEKYLSTPSYYRSNIISSFQCILL